MSNLRVLPTTTEYYSTKEDDSVTYSDMGEP